MIYFFVGRSATVRRGGLDAGTWGVYGRLKGIILTAIIDGIHSWPFPSQTPYGGCSRWINSLLSAITETGSESRPHGLMVGGASRTTPVLICI